MDIPFLDKAAYWSLFAYIAFVCLALVMSVIVLVVSYQRSAAMQGEMKRLQRESQERIAAADRLLAEANQRIAESNAAAAQAQSEAAAAALVEAQLRKENLQLSVELARERREVRAAVAGPPGEPRVLTEEQLESVSSSLIRFAEKAVTIVELSDPEAAALARQIASALERARWSVYVSRVGALSPPQHGIICSHPANDAAASALVTALRSVNAIVYERTENLDQVRLIVGLKP